MTNFDYYRDPLDALRSQLIELRGLVTLVPRLIDADRNQRWAEIGQRPGDPDSEMIDIYEGEAGEDEGFGHADYGRAVRAAALVSAWESFREFLSRELANRYLKYDNLSKFPLLAKLADEEQRGWDRRFDTLVRRYREAAEIRLTELHDWNSVKHAHELRNALVHNFGKYTGNYLKAPLAQRPPEDLPFCNVADDAQLIDRELIPLSEEFSLGVVNSLIAAAVHVREQLDANGRASK
jgi:hypothetical protein